MYLKNENGIKKIMSYFMCKQTKELIFQRFGIITFN